MEELKRTKRITIAVFAFLAVIIIGALSIKKPKEVYQFTPQQMNEELILVYQVPPEEAVDLLKDTISTVFVDLRSIYDYEKGKLGNAINIPIPMLLKDDNLALFESWKKDSITVVFYGNDQLQANAPWMLMYQLGYTNTVTLMGGKNYMDKLMNGLLTDNSIYEMEYPAVDFKAILEERGTGQQTVVTQTPKKSVVVRKKKKKAAEGGC
jgi:rhodanese-related sulfurtransferase